MTQEKWTIDLWDTPKPVIGETKPLLRRDYAKAASVGRALAALWAAYPAARLAWVTRYTWKGYWGGQIEDRVTRPYRCAACGGTEMDWSAEETEYLATCVKCGSEWNEPFDDEEAPS